LTTAETRLKPVITSSNTSKVPVSSDNSRSPFRNSRPAGIIPPEPSTGSTVMEASFLLPDASSSVNVVIGQYDRIAQCCLSQSAGEEIIVMEKLEIRRNILRL
jgi:hypothetical protein